MARNAKENSKHKNNTKSAEYNAIDEYRRGSQKTRNNIHLLKKIIH